LLLLLFLSNSLILCAPSYETERAEMSNKVPASSLTVKIREMMIKIARLMDIQKASPMDSAEWQAASKQLQPLFKVMVDAKAPHPMHIDWSL
jgi:hypothetical protein